MKLWMWLLVGFSVAGISFWLIVVTHANPIPVALFVRSQCRGDRRNLLDDVGGDA